jgi:hypothetical protein
VPGRNAVILRLLAIERRGSTLREGMAVFTLASEERSAVQLVLTPVRGHVSRIREGIALVGVSQYLLGSPHDFRDRCLAGLHGCHPSAQVGLSRSHRPNSLR